eukprot:s4382_g5.t1
MIQQLEKAKQDKEDSAIERDNVLVRYDEIFEERQKFLSERNEYMEMNFQQLFEQAKASNKELKRKLTKAEADLNRMRELKDQYGHETGEMEEKEKNDMWQCLRRFGKRKDKNTWASNLATPCSAWIFLFLVVLLSCLATYVFSLFVFWADGTSTNFFVGLLYIVANAFCLWSIIEFFLTTVSFHAIRLILGMPRLPRKDFIRGLPSSARTVLSYCLLSRQQESSEECFKTACEAHLANLDSNNLITTAVVSVSSDLPVVQCEMDCRDRCRKKIVETLMDELKVLLEVFSQGFPTREGETLQMRRATMHQALETVSKGSTERVDYWLQCVDAAWADLLQRVDDAAQHFIYLHRNCRILKKPGQYQDLMVLASTGMNEAFTYLREDYGQLGRPAGSACFGFAANVTKPQEMSPEDFTAATQALAERGQEDIALLTGYGSNPDTRYHYTMVLDSDTVCPAKSIRKLLETAEHSANQSYGIINANLANDYSADDSCTMHIWKLRESHVAMGQSRCSSRFIYVRALGRRNALMEVSTVNLQRGQFWIFNRVGFYGKGLRCGHRKTRSGWEHHILFVGRLQKGGAGHSPTVNRGTVETARFTVFTVSRFTVPRFNRGTVEPEPWPTVPRLAWVGEHRSRVEP